MWNSDPTYIWLSPLQGKASTWHTLILPRGWLWDHEIILWVGGWPLTSTWGTKDSVTHTKEDIQELWNPTITLILYDGGIQNPQYILYYWFSKNKQKLVFMKQKNLPVPKSSFLREPRPQYLGWKQQKDTTLRASWKLRDVWWDPLLFLCSLSLLLFCFMEG